MFTTSRRKKKDLESATGPMRWEHHWFNCEPLDSKRTEGKKSIYIAHTCMLGPCLPEGSDTEPRFCILRGDTLEEARELLLHDLVRVAEYQNKWKWCDEPEYKIAFDSRGKMRPFLRKCGAKLARWFGEWVCEEVHVQCGIKELIIA